VQQVRLHDGQHLVLAKTSQPEAQGGSEEDKGRTDPQSNKSSVDQEKTFL
jgi:hypothetical protein